MLYKVHKTLISTLLINFEL